MLKKFLGAFFFIAILGSSCQIGTSQFESNVKNFDFAPNGTAFSFLDDRKDTSGNDIFPKPFSIALTWISIDPARDLNDFGNTEKRRIISAFKTHDALSITFADESQINTHSLFTKADLEGWIQFDSRTKGVNTSQLMDVIEVKIDQYEPLSHIQGTIQFRFGTVLINGSFYAPILQGEKAKMAKWNWETLRN